MSGKFVQIGNKTECALLEMAYNLGFDFRQVRKQHKILRIIPFSSQRKKMSCVVELENGRTVIFSKGAPDFLLQNCSHFAREVNNSTENSPINEEFKDVLNHTLSNFASESLRTLLLCYREVRKD